MIDLMMKGSMKYKREMFINEIFSKGELNYQIINGKSSGTSSVTFTYTCTIDKAGTVSIPPAAFKINGKTYKTNTVTIHASGSTHHTPNSANTQQQDQTVTPSSNGRITAKDLFITVSANKTSVCEQEPIVLTYKIYTRVNLTQLSDKMDCSSVTDSYSTNKDAFTSIPNVL